MPKRGKLAERDRVGNYDRLLAEQGGVCAICRALPGDRRFAVDHEHWSGRIRGLLCTRCNLALGYLRDNPAAARRAVDYLIGRPVDGIRRCIDCGEAFPVPMVAGYERWGATLIADWARLSCCRTTPTPPGRLVVTERPMSGLH